VVRLFAGLLVILLLAPAAPLEAAEGPRVSAECRRTSSARLRRWRAARARYLRELRELSVPRFRTDAEGKSVPTLRSGVGVIMVPSSGEVLWEENGESRRSIASITKMMTALVAVDAYADPSTEIEIVRADVRRASKTKLRAGERVSVEGLMHLLMLSSDNAAARALARASQWGPAGFVARMNARAKELGLTATRFADPSGLDAGNLSTAHEIAKLAVVAAEDPRVSALMRTRSYALETSRKQLTLSNTNRLLSVDELEVHAGKTGYTDPAGYCLASVVNVPGVPEPAAIVVLGSRSRLATFFETRHLANWAASHTPVAPVLEPAAPLESLNALVLADGVEAAPEVEPRPEQRLEAERIASAGFVRRSGACLP